MTKQRIISILVVLGLLLVPATVLAQAETEPVEVNSTAPTTTQTQNQAGNKEEARNNLDDRLAERQAQVSSKLDANRERVLEQKCNAAQNRLQAALSNGNAVYANRVGLYEGLIERVEAVVSRINTNLPDVDTSGITSAIASLQQLIDSFMEDFDVYLLAVEDTANLTNCDQEPQDFHDLLESSRQLRAELKNSASEIRSYVVGDLKATIQTIRSQLGDTDSQEASEPAAEETQ